ncbi:MAG: LamG-like jellyroll fold domain-containing protein [Planctomycetaceae bacterium]
MTFMRLFVAILTVQVGTIAIAHEGPDPLAHWRFDADSIKSSEASTTVAPRLGPAATLRGNWSQVPDEAGGAIFLSGGGCGIEVTPDHNTAKKFLPEAALTVSAWVTVDKPLRWGGLAGAVEDDGDVESGWVLGYDDDTFTFALRGADEPHRLTYLKGKQKYEQGKWYHVVAVYDGELMQLFVNGKLDAESREQSGDIVYPAKTSFMLGAYHDANEHHGHRGRIREISIYDLAAKPAWVTHEFEHNAALAVLPAAPVVEPLQFVIRPYLQFGTQTSMTVMWRTNYPATTVLHYGENDECNQTIEVEGLSTLHEITIPNLQPQTQYFYRTESRAAAEEKSLTENVGTFQTVVKPETPFAFAVMSDTQGNPTVSGRLAEFAWGQRPSFLLHTGDLVETGPNDAHWTEHFFPSMNPLIRHVPFYPVLGNHEQNARNYFDYVSLPKPEYYYTFEFGNTQFFMVDSNRNVDPDSEQYRWLDEELAKSKAAWKICCHHHPPYSSDENDYGNLWKTNKGTRGDLRVRQLVTLYEKHQVDIVWNGHIHSYERTWPVRENKAVEQDGPIYMITGGGGGHLETAGPVRPYFQNTVRYGHHYVMVRINGQTMELQAYDIDNRLFDQLVIRKSDTTPD